MNWSTEMMVRRFAPREVAGLTGVAEDRQRLIANRYFDFRESIEPINSHRRWGWEGIQALAAFQEIMTDMPNAGRALDMVKGDSQSLSYQMDLRDRDEDTLFAYYFDTPVLAGAAVTTPKGIGQVFGFADAVSRPARLYVYNLSDLQRRLCDKLDLDR